MLNQNASVKEQQAFLENQILNMNYDAACQIITVGKAHHTMFMNMSSPERRKFVECILNLTIFSSMAKLQTAKISDMKTRVSDLKSAVQVSSDKIDIRERYIRDLQTADRDQAEARKKALSEQKESADLLVESLSKEFDKSLESKPFFDKSAFDDITSKLNSSTIMQSKLSSKIEETKDNLIKLDRDKVCVCCGQVLTDELKNEHIASNNEKLAKLETAIVEINEQIDSLTLDKAGLEDVKARYDKQSSEHIRLDLQLSSAKDKVKSIVKDLDSDVIDNSEKIDAAKKELHSLKDMNTKLNAALGSALEKSSYMNMISLMLKDTGIKTALIKKFIPIINTEVNRYLKKLGLFATFTLDENFDETIKASGFNELEYNSFSEGEKLRIDLSILLAQRHIAKMQGIVDSNILVLDEIVDASLDQDGISALTDSLKLMQDLNVFIVTHQPDKMIDSVRSVLKFEKIDGFSRIATSS